MTGIFDIQQVMPYLYLSAATPVTAANIDRLRIALVINASRDLQAPDHPTVGYLQVKVDDLPYERIDEFFDMVAMRIETTRRQGGKALVHCRAGVSRSASLVIAHLMKYEGMTLSKAYNHVKDRRRWVAPNEGFWKQLIQYERKLYGRTSVNSGDDDAAATPDYCFGRYHTVAPPSESPHRSSINRSTSPTCMLSREAPVLAAYRSSPSIPYSSYNRDLSPIRTGRRMYMRY
ncbi:PREDICTED: dual specificity protein phosphatase 18-like [Priapulus caudatus]|uniref:Dual specificity protein phosphatase 18-like n=1 Tax=Priapulus caudatus TaxID=37621 RepID=A0ABM1EI20_PRICU|nr:PREDICTED: dual specificity protein phosphatase 18-like [Priapulus caudatus]